MFAVIVVLVELPLLGVSLEPASMPRRRLDIPVIFVVVPLVPGAAADDVVIRLRRALFGGVDGCTSVAGSSVTVGLFRDLTSSSVTLLVSIVASSFSSTST